VISFDLSEGHPLGIFRNVTRFSFYFDTIEFAIVCFNLLFISDDVLFNSSRLRIFSELIVAKFGRTLEPFRDVFTILFLFTTG
jgi:hypothetical protein